MPIQVPYLDSFFSRTAVLDMSGADIELPNSQGLTALMIAAQLHYYNIFSLLVRRGKIQQAPLNREKCKVHFVSSLVHGPTFIVPPRSMKSLLPVQIVHAILKCSPLVSVGFVRCICTSNNFFR